MSGVRRNAAIVIASVALVIAIAALVVAVTREPEASKSASATTTTFPTMPRVTQMTLQQATAVLQQAGFVVSSRTVHSELAPGTVVSQSQRDGGRSVLLGISSGTP
jgi:hypothetical protein